MSSGKQAARHPQRISFRFGQSLRLGAPAAGDGRNGSRQQVLIFCYVSFFPNLCKVFLSPSHHFFVKVLEP